MGVDGPTPSDQPAIRITAGTLDGAQEGELPSIMLANACELYRDAGCPMKPASRYSSQAFASIMSSRFPKRSAGRNRDSAFGKMGWQSHGGPRTDTEVGFVSARPRDVGFRSRLATLLSWAWTFLGTWRGQLTNTHQQITARNAIAQLRYLERRIEGTEADVARAS